MPARIARRHVVGQRPEIVLAAPLPLLPQHVKPRQLPASRLSSAKSTMSSPSDSGGPEAVHRLAVSSRWSTISPQHLLGVVEQLARRRANRRVVEDRAGTCPSVPRPGRRATSRCRGRFPRAESPRSTRTPRNGGPVDRAPSPSRCGNGGGRPPRREPGAPAAARRIPRVAAAGPRSPARTPVACWRLVRRSTTPTQREASSTWTVGCRTAARSSPPCAWRWSSRRRSAAACVKPAALHFLGHVHHLVEAGRDQPRQADDVDTRVSAAVCRIFSQGIITPRSMTS